MTVIADPDPPPPTPPIDPVGVGVGLPDATGGAATASGWNGSFPSNAWPVSGGVVGTAVELAEGLMLGFDVTGGISLFPPPLSKRSTTASTTMIPSTIASARSRGPMLRRRAGIRDERTSVMVLPSPMETAMRLRREPGR